MSGEQIVLELMVESVRLERAAMAQTPATIAEVGYCNAMQDLRKLAWQKLIDAGVDPRIQLSEMLSPEERAGLLD